MAGDVGLMYQKQSMVELDIVHMLGKISKNGADEWEIVQNNFNRK